METREVPSFVPSGRLARAAAEALSIRPGEGVRTALLFTQLLLSSAVFVMGRTVRDTLFLSRYSIHALPWMFVLYGVASAITVVLYSRVADRMARDKTIVGWSALGIATYLGTYACVKASQTWIYPVFYVWAEVFANLLISQFWTLANDLHDTRAAKRLFGTVGAARVLGIIVVGLATGSIVRLIGTEQLLFVLCGFMALIAAIALRLGREPRATKAPTQSTRAKSQTKPPSVLGNGYVRALSLMMLLTFSALTIGDYQFKAIARATYREDALASFFSYFYAGTGIISFAFQLFATPRLLARFGVGMGMSVMPAVFGAASATLLGVPHLPVATMMKFADNGFQYSIHETTIQALYVPFPAAVKVRTRAFLDAVVKPFAYALGGIALLVFAPIITEVQNLSIVSVVLVAGWIATIPAVRSRYMAALEKTLHSAGLAALGDEPVRDAGGKEILLAALDSPDPRVVLAALDELGASSEPEVLAALERLARHDDAAIRVGALTRLGPHARATESASDDEAIRHALVDSVPEVRAAAVTAFAVANADESVETLAPMLDDETRQVRSAALVGLLAYAGFEGVMVGGSKLTKLIESRDAEDRADAALALGAIGHTGARRLIPLLDDADRVVRLSALDAAREVADIRLLPVVLRRFDERPTRVAASQALAAMGDPAIPALVSRMADPNYDRTARLTIPRVLRSVRTPQSYESLRRFIDAEDSHLRLRVLSAMSRLRQSLERPAEAIELVRRRILAESSDIYATQAAYERDRESLSTPLFDDLIDHRGERGARRILRLLELRYEPGPLRLVRERMQDPVRKANALEVLDTQLEPSLRPIVMPFFDDVPVARKLGERSDVKVLGPEDFIRAQCRHPNPYVAMVLVDALRTHQHPLLAETSREATNHPSPFVREAAALALVTLGPSANSAIEALASDTDPVVARVARLCLDRLASPTPTENPMYSTVEKLLLLRTAPMFAKLRGEDLATLARVAVVETYADGEKVFAEHDPSDALYVVVRGKVRIVRNEERLATFGSGEAFGEMGVLDSQPRSADAVADGHTEVLRIDSEEFYDALHEQVEIAEGVIRMLSRRLREANETLEASKH